MLSCRVIAIGVLLVDSVEDEGVVFAASESTVAATKF
jgi:hypothetical protein